MKTGGEIYKVHGYSIIFSLNIYQNLVNINILARNHKQNNIKKMSFIFV